jgi:hypothetical protein
MAEGDVHAVVAHWLIATNAVEVKSEPPKFRPIKLSVADEHVGRLGYCSCVTAGESNV